MLQHPDFSSTTGHGEKATIATVLAGILVGFGAHMGSGCVSGHGVCGLPRLSLRSLTAVATFMVTGAGGALVGRQLEAAMPGVVAVPGVADLLQWVHAVHDGDGHLAGGHVPAIAVALSVFAFFLALRAARGLSARHQAEADAEAASRHKKTDGDGAAAVCTAPPATRPLEHVLHFITAFGFGWGLCMSGMVMAR